MCDVTRESCGYILTKKGPGNSIAIVVGGAAEALDAHPGSFALTLNKKKGFIKLALQTGLVYSNCTNFSPVSVALDVIDMDIKVKFALSPRSPESDKLWLLQLFFLYLTSFSSY